MSFTPQSEPSHSLIDRVCQQLEDNVITYIELNRCSSRHDEALHSKIDTSLALDNAGGLRLSKKQRLDDVNVTGEHKLRQAFLRRSLAYDLAGIATFAVLDLWTQKLFEKMNEAPLSTNPKTWPAKFDATGSAATIMSGNVFSKPAAPKQAGARTPTQLRPAEKC